MDKRQEKISNLILNYLQKNPMSGDTLEGITRWWLELERIEQSVDEVVKVLNNLIAKNILRIHKTKEGAIYYKVDKVEF